MLDGRGRRNACGNRYDIRLPKWARQPVVVIHEVSHSIHCNLWQWTPGQEYATHGSMFVRTYIEVLLRFEYSSGRREAITDSARKYHVKIGRRDVFEKSVARHKEVFIARVKMNGMDISSLNGEPKWWLRKAAANMNEMSYPPRTGLKHFRPSGVVIGVKEA